MAQETWVQSPVESYQRLKKWYLMPPCLTLSIIRYWSRVKWINPGKGVAPSPTPWCSKLSKREPSGHPRLWSPSLILLTSLQRSKASHRTKALDMTLNNLMVRLQYSWSFGECGVSLHCHDSQVHLNRSDNTWLDALCRSNRTVWHLNWVQTNDLR